MKLVIYIIIVLLVIIGFFPYLIYSVNSSFYNYDYNDYEYYNQKYVEKNNSIFIDNKENTFLAKNGNKLNLNSSSNLIIDEFSSNFNEIIITLKNVGDKSISNIKIDVNITDGIFIIKSKRHYEIPIILSGEKEVQRIKIFGLGLGVFKNFPKFIFTINSPDINEIVGQITARVLGSVIQILCKSYNNSVLSEGYTLISPMWDSKTYLIDKSGDIVHFWNSIHLETQAAYLLENGNLVRTSIVPFSKIFSGGAQGFIEMFNWDGNRVWKFKYSTKEYCQHHDVEILPNGNILLIAWEVKNYTEIVDAGKNPDNIYRKQLWSDFILEIEPSGSYGGNIVWEWHAWDHLIQDYDINKNNYGIISEHPELIDINFGRDWIDWLHVNSIDYNEKLDQILISVFNFNEIWIIDHNTTTEEAAGHTGGNSGKGGDLLYRWGNPQSYDHGDEIEQKFFGQHGSYWIESNCPGEGNILVFNNRGGSMTESASSVVEIVPPLDSDGNYIYNQGSAYDPVEPVWTFVKDNPSEMYSYICSNAQRLLNGNTLICSATQARVIEVTPEKETIWLYQNPFPNWYFVKTLPEVIQYSPDYPGVKNLTNQTIINSDDL